MVLIDFQECFSPMQCVRGIENTRSRMTLVNKTLGFFLLLFFGGRGLLGLKIKQKMFRRMVLIDFQDFFFFHQCTCNVFMELETLEAE